MKNRTINWALRALPLTIFLITINCAHSHVLILHEKLSGATWVLAATWLDEPEQIGDAVTAIEEDPAQRRGPSFAVFGGIRLTLESVENPGGTQWMPDDAMAGNVVVFWHSTGSTDPSDWHTEILPGIPEAEAFIQAVKADPARELWDDRPLLVDQAWTATETEPSIEWILRP